MPGRVLREADDQRAVDLERDVVHALAERGDGRNGLVGEVLTQNPAHVVGGPAHSAQATDVMIVLAHRLKG